MKSIQETFNAVMDGGYYVRGAAYPTHPNVKRSRYMCYALSYAVSDGVITFDEACDASQEINNYLSLVGSRGNTLHRVLDILCFDVVTDPILGVMCRLVYKNWEARPKNAEQALELLAQAEAYQRAMEME